MISLNLNFLELSLKLLFKFTKRKLLLFLISLLIINKSLNTIIAENNEILIKGSNIDFILRLLKKADKRNAPKIVINKDRSKSIIYKKNNYQKTLSQKELLYLIKNPESYLYEEKFIKETLNFLNNLGISLILTDFQKEHGSAYWLPINKLIKIDKKAINSGSLTFARILNHEMIHIAQSCKGGSINSIPELIGINEKMNEEKHILLKSKVYKNLSKYEISLEKEAYSYQDNLSAGKYLIKKFC